MLKIELEKSGSVQIVRLSGAVDETFDLSKKLTAFPPSLHVYCGAINRINSVGVKEWVAYFGGAPAGTDLRFYECSPVIVEQMNMIRNFIPANRAVSIQLTFNCGACGKTVTRVMGIKDIVQVNFAVPRVVCDCGGQAEFDDVPEEYFRFLMRT